MSVGKEKNNKALKLLVLIIGGFLIVAGIFPYINSYLLSDNANDDISANEAEIMTSSSEKNKPIQLDNASLLIQKESTIESEAGSRTQNTSIDSDLKNDSEQQTAATHLPTLHESDQFLLANIASLTTKSLFIPIDIIRNMVVFTDNFSRGELVDNFSPLKKPIEAFSVTKKKGVLIIDSQSYLRYDKYAHAIEAIDSEKFIKLYSLITPLIDQAYAEIGYPQGSFNQTFNKAIDHVLDTPILYYKLEVTSSSVMYQYTDEYLESLPDTQKLMLRMGPDNLLIVKEKLQEIQNELQRL